MIEKVVGYEAAIILALIILIPIACVVFSSLWKRRSNKWRALKGEVIARVAQGLFTSIVGTLCLIIVIKSESIDLLHALFFTILGVINLIGSQWYLLPLILRGSLSDSKTK